MVNDACSLQCYYWILIKVNKCLDVPAVGSVVVDVVGVVVVIVVVVAGFISEKINPS